MNEQFPVYQKLLKKRPPILFHYTTPTGLLGIVCEKKIWATDLRFLNDKKEFQHSLDITHSILNDFYKVNETQNKFKRLNYDFIEHLRLKLGNNWNPEVYVVSFTEEGDLLSQWRGYCPKGGFSIGFDPVLLSDIANNNECFLWPCIYEFKKQKQVFEELLLFYNKKYDDAIDGIGLNNSDQLLNDISIEFILRLFSYAPMFKHESFKEEKEWRIVFYNLESKSLTNLKFRANESDIIPYVEIPLCKSDEETKFKKIFIGPASINNYSKKAVLQLFSKKQVAERAIRFSSVPYRST